MRKDVVTPVSSARSQTNCSACRLGTSKRRTSPCTMCPRCCFTACAVTWLRRSAKSSSRYANSASVSVSPLSPARAWASSCSLRFTILFKQCHLGAHAAALQEQRHHADSLLRKAPDAAAARGAVDPERLDFGADALGELARGRARRDPQPHLVRRLRMAEVAAMRAADPDEVDANVADVLAQTLTHDLTAERRALQRLGSGVRDLAFAHEPGAIADAHLVGASARSPGALGHRDPVRRRLAQPHGGEVGDHVGRDVAARIGDLIQEWL